MLVSQMRIIYLHCDTALIPKKVSKELVKGVMFCQSNCWPKIIRPLLIFFKPWYTRPLTVCFKLLFSSQFNGFYEENTDICVNEIQKKIIQLKLFIYTSPLFTHKIKKQTKICYGDFYLIPFENFFEHLTQIHNWKQVIFSW